MPLIFEISRDPQLLDQYYRLRNIYFKRDLGIRDFDGFEDDGDRHGRILLAHRDGKVIAGARISRSTSLHDQLQEFGLRADECCMWERFVMHPSARTMDLGRDFCSAMIDVSRNLGYRQAMVLSTLRISRLYRLCHAGLGVEFNIERPAPECAQGAFAHLDHYLSVAHLEPRETARETSRRLPVHDNRALHYAA